MKGEKTSKRFTNQNEAVSEIIGTLLLVTMAVVMFSAIMIIVLNPWINYSDDSPPLVTIVGYVRGDQVILEHQGGINLDQNTRITITVASTDHSFTLGGSPYFTDLNGDGKWNIGEDVVYTEANLQGKQIKCMIIDVEKNALVMDKTIQQGNTILIPYAQILDPMNVDESSAMLRMYYNFINADYFQSGFLNFTYGVIGGPYNKTTQVKPLMSEGWYSAPVKGLQSGSLYECWAYLKYNGGSMLNGSLLFYTYQDARGIWHFDEAPGDNTAHDSMNPHCDGKVYGATFISGGKVNGSLHFEGTSQSVDVPHHPKFNITNAITIKTWLNLTKIGEKFPGNISDIIDTMNLVGNLSVVCFEPDIIHVDSSINDRIYAIAYHDNTSGYVSTIRINNNGDIQNIIQTVSLSVTHFLEPDIVHINGDIYAIAFGAAENQVEKKGHIVTISIDGNGGITQLHTFDFEEYYGREPRIIHIAGDTYAITFGGCGLSHTIPTGELVTITIDPQGQIGNHTIDKLKFPQNYCSETDIIHVANNTYAIMYNGIDEKQGYLRTVKISLNGQIVNGSFVDSFQFGLPSDWLEPSIIHIFGDVFAVSYGADSNNQKRNGFLQTVCIHSNGTIQHTIISSLSFPTTYSSETDIISVGNDIYAIAYSGGDDSFGMERGFLITVDIDNSGFISGSVNDLVEFTGRKGLEPGIIKLFGQNDQFAIVYGTDSSDTGGFLVTVKIDSVGLSRWVLQKGDMFGINVNGNRLIATMTIGGVSYTVSGLVSLTWNYIVLTYGMGTLTLKINGAVSPDGSVSCSGTIKTNQNHLIFGGGFYGSLDELEIYSKYIP